MTLDSAVTLQSSLKSTGLTGWYVSLNGDICYTAGGSSNKIRATDLTISEPNTTDLPFVVSTAIGSFTNDGTWFYLTQDGGIRLRKIRMTAVGVGGDPNVSPPAADHVLMAEVDPFAGEAMGAVTIGPDGTLYISERASSTGPFYVKSVLKDAPYTRTTVATLPQAATALAVDDDNVIWAICATSFADPRLYKASGTPTIWSGDSTALLVGLCASGGYLYVVRYPTTGASRFPGGSPSRAIQVSRFSKATPGTYADMVGGTSFGYVEGIGSVARFTALRSIAARGDDALVVYDNGLIRQLGDPNPSILVSDVASGTETSAIALSDIRGLASVKMSSQRIFRRRSR